MQFGKIFDKLKEIFLSIMNLWSTKMVISETPVPIQFTPFLGILAGAVVTLLGQLSNLISP